MQTREGIRIYTASGLIDFGIESRSDIFATDHIADDRDTHKTNRQRREIPPEYPDLADKSAVIAYCS